MGSAKKWEEVIVEIDRQLSTQTLCQALFRDYGLYGFCLDFNPMSFSCLPLTFPAGTWNLFDTSESVNFLYSLFLQCIFGWSWNKFLLVTNVGSDGIFSHDLSGNP